jgi:protein-disulfide isomerase
VNPDRIAHVAVLKEKTMKARTVGQDSFLTRDSFFTHRWLVLVAASALMLGLAACGEQKKAETPPPDVKPAIPAALLQAGPLGDKVLGKDDAPVTIIEYASLTCSHCANFHATTFGLLKEKYVDAGKVRLIFREFPLDPLSTAASMIARCASEPRYFPMVSVMFQQQRQWAGSDKPLEELLAIARQAGFTQESFESCLKDQKIYDGLNEAKKRGAEVHGVNSTPTFFINGEIRRGDMSIEELDKVIEPLLKK